MARRERNIRRAIFFTAVIGIVILLCGSLKSSGRVGESVYCISTGDTLWSIAEEHKPNDITYREYMDLLYKLNDGLTAEIYPGQAILVPVYKEE